MHYGTIKNFDIANGPGVRVSLFVSGCRNHCKGCFNPQTWNFEYGKKFTWDTVHEIETLLMNPNVRGLSILGGDPFEPENRQWVETMCAHVKHNISNRDIWVWTGYNFEDLRELSIFKYIDVLVDGPFEQDKKDLSLVYRGSWNQRVIDIPKSLEHGCTINLEADWR
jgi:anaerobic ribonucleoside-triphosphate reductase activating protein